MNLNRSIKPDPKGEISFRLPPIDKFELDNGLKVLLAQRHNLPLLRFNFVVNAGSRFDPVQKKGLANLFSMMIDEGAGGLNALELSDEFDTLGTNFDSSGSSDSIFLSLRTLKENYLRSFELLNMIINEPHLKEEDYERERRKVLVRLLQHKDDPEEIADLAFEYILFGKSNPYAFPTIGFEEDVLNISNDNIKEFYSDFFSPNNSTLIIVGDTSKDEMIDLLNTSFKDWKRSSKNNLAIPERNGKNARVYFVHKENAVQSEVRIGHLSKKRNEEDYFSRNTLNIILGGQFTSRINLNLREDKGYTYGAFSRFSYYKDEAYFYASTSVGIENTGNAINEIMKELNNIREGVTPEELEFAKLSTTRKFPANFETNRQIAMNLTGMVIHNLPDDYFNNYLNKVNSVTEDDVRKAALENICPEEAVILVVGDKEKLLPQLKQFGDVVEVNYKGEII